MPDLVRPAHVSIPDYHATLGPEVAAVATLAGFPPDPEQQLLLDAGFAIDKQGKSVAFETVAIAPRQNLKTGLFKQAALGMLFVRNERLVVWSAHEFSTAQEALRDMEALIGASEILSRRVKRTNRGDIAKHGAVPEIELLSGARLIFRTRTAGGGRGLSGRKVFLDEAYALQAGQVGALMPVMLAQPDPQVWIGSSACRPESAVLWDIVQRGRAGGDPRMAYAEWCAPEPKDACDDGESCDHTRNRPGCGCDKPELIRLAHSAITRGRILIETVQDLRTLPPEEYGREVMGWHDTPADGLPPIDPMLWAALEDPESQIDGSTALAIDVKADESASCIAASGRRSDSLRHGEITGNGKTLDYRPGTGWVVDRVVQIAERNGPCVLVLDPSGPAGALVPALIARGFVKVKDAADKIPADKWRLYLVGAREYAQSCGAIAGDIRNNLWRHLNQQPLNDAVEGTRTRPLADAYAWSRKDSNVDISPFVATTLARHGHVLFGDADTVVPFVAWGNR